MQTGGGWMLGGAFPFWSVSGGPQVEIRISYLLQDGRWWLYLNGAPVGFYPVGIFNGGGMAQQSSLMKFGGETATRSNNNWPPMGSGALTTPTREEVAYQRRSTLLRARRPGAERQPAGRRAAPLLLCCGPGDVRSAVGRDGVVRRAGWIAVQLERRPGGRGSELSVAGAGPGCAPTGW